MNNQTELGEKTKNIVLVTWKGAGNFGTCLQCYALYKKINDLGFSVSLLSFFPPYYSFKLFVKWLLSLVHLDIILNRNGHKSLQQIKIEKFQKIYNEIVLYTKFHERRLVKETDCFISGSDQIWNTYYEFNPKYFLSFTSNKKRISYASSIGTRSIKEEFKNEVKQLLMRFSHISVRENEAVEVLSELTERTDIVKVLDPTFLLLPEDWQIVSQKSEFEIKIPKSYLLCYLIGDNKKYIKMLEDVKNKINIDNIVIVPSTESSLIWPQDVFIYNNASPVEFVWLIQHAKYVCTDSFHATALSINHSVPFVEFMRFDDSDEKSQNSRIVDILAHFELTDCIYNQDSEKWIAPIDFIKVQNKLCQDRDYSIKYLKQSIEN